MADDRSRATLTYRDLSFPVQMFLMTEDTSKFQDVHDMLVHSGLIPKSVYAHARPLEERINNPLPWQEESCCVLAIPGREHLAETETNGWGIYRVTFKGPIEKQFPQHIPSIESHIEFKYFLKGLPEQYLQYLVVNENPMRELAKRVYDLVQPKNILINGGYEIPFPYLD